MAYGAIAQGSLVILKSKQFWIGLAIIILIIIIISQWSNIRSWFKKKTQKEDITLTEDEIVRLEEFGSALSNDTKDRLKQLAQLLHSDIYDTPISGHDHDLYTQALNLTDTELKFMAEYYRKYISGGVYLEEDIDNEIFSPFTNIDSRLMAKLSTIGEKSF